MPTNWIRLAVAEAIGAFALVFVGVLSLTVGGLGGGLVGSALAYGLVVAVMVAALGHISGGHFNPAVTLGFVVTRRMNLATGALYWGAQLAGALVAGLVVLAATSRDLLVAGTPVVSEGVSAGAAILLELVATFFVVLVVFGTAVDQGAPRSVYPFAIGLTVTVAVLSIGAATGGAVNPARWFGAGIASWTWSDFYVYWIGPLIGGALGALAHRWLTTAAPAKPVAAQPSDETANVATANATTANATTANATTASAATASAATSTAPRPTDQAVP